MTITVTENRVKALTRKQIVRKNCLPIELYGLLQLQPGGNLKHLFGCKLSAHFTWSFTNMLQAFFSM